MNLKKMIRDLVTSPPTPKKDAPKQVAKTNEVIEMCNSVIRAAKRYSLAIDDNNIAENITRALHGRNR